MSRFRIEHKGYLYRRTRMNAVASLFWAVALLVLYALYMRNAAVYFPNAVSSGHALDTGAFAAATKELVIEPQSEPFDCSGYGVTPPPMLRLSEVYRHGAYYRFKLIADDVRETGLGYAKAPDGSRLLIDARQEGESTARMEDRIAVVTVAGREYAAIVPAEQSLEAGSVIPYAVFIELPLYIGHDLGLTDEAGNALGNWCLDLRGISVDDEGGDFALIIIFSILFPLFFIFTLACVINPRLHPNYMFLNHFAADIEQTSRDIDAEIEAEGVYKEGKLVYTERYIIRETLYSTRVMKNHMYRN